MLEIVGNKRRIEVTHQDLTSHISNNLVQKLSPEFFLSMRCASTVIGKQMCFFTEDTQNRKIEKRDTQFQIGYEKAVMTGADWIGWNRIELGRMGSH